MTLMSITNTTVVNDKEQMLYIFKGYMNTRPNQSNLFGKLMRCYKSDMLENAEDTDRQRQEIQNSLSMIYTRYNYTSIEVSVTLNELAHEFIIEISAVSPTGVAVKLSESLIFDNKTN